LTDPLVAENARINRLRPPPAMQKIVASDVAKATGYLLERDHAVAFLKQSSAPRTLAVLVAKGAAAISGGLRCVRPRNRARPSSTCETSDVAHLRQCGNFAFAAAAWMTLGDFFGSVFC
jgi:hypothetical protein